MRLILSRLLVWTTLANAIIGMPIIVMSVLLLTEINKLIVFIISYAISIILATFVMFPTLMVLIKNESKPKNVFHITALGALVFLAIIIFVASYYIFRSNMSENWPVFNPVHGITIAAIISIIGSFGIRASNLK